MPFLMLAIVALSSSEKVTIEAATVLGPALGPDEELRPVGFVPPPGQIQDDGFNTEVVPDKSKSKKRKNIHKASAGDKLTQSTGSVRNWQNLLKKNSS